MLFCTSSLKESENNDKELLKSNYCHVMSLKKNFVLVTHIANDYNYNAVSEETMPIDSELYLMK